MKQRIQVLAWKRHIHEAENSGAGVEKTQTLSREFRCWRGKDTNMKQRIQVLAWKRHKHEAENSGAGMEQTQT
jgi:predicted RecA/RadA family phage recombinase